MPRPDLRHYATRQHRPHPGNCRNVTTTSSAAGRRPVKATANCSGVESSVPATRPTTPAGPSSCPFAPAPSADARTRRRPGSRLTRNDTIRHDAPSHIKLTGLIAAAGEHPRQGHRQEPASTPRRWPGHSQRYMTPYVPAPRRMSGEAGDASTGLALPAVPPSLVHGDLAGANLRCAPDGKLLASWNGLASAGTAIDAACLGWHDWPAVQAAVDPQTCHRAMVWQRTFGPSGSSVRGSARRAALTSSSAPPHGCADPGPALTGGRGVDHAKYACTRGHHHAPPDAHYFRQNRT